MGESVARVGERAADEWPLSANCQMSKKKGTATLSVAVPFQTYPLAVAELATADEAAI